MTSAEIKKMIVEEAKKQGLVIAEDAAIAFAKFGFGLGRQIIIATDTKLDDLFLPVLGIAEPKVMEYLDKIDGEEG